MDAALQVMARATVISTNTIMGMGMDTATDMDITEASMGMVIIPPIPQKNRLLSGKGCLAKKSNHDWR
jgi:hypothetical protein